MDSSVLLRPHLGEAGVLREWPRIESAVTSRIARVECLRTIDRLRLVGDLTDADAAELRARIGDAFRSVEVLQVSGAVLDRAGGSFPTVVRTLDAIHLATASLRREQSAPDLVFATHDGQLGTAARALGFRVIGL